MNHAQFWGGAAAPYEIEQSLRFNSGDSAHLNRTPGSAGNRKTWTWSGWVKRAGFGQNFLFTTGANSSNRLQISFENYTNDQLALEAKSGGSTQALLVTNAVHRDPSAWYHIVVALDTTQATPANRLKFYVNGQEQTSFYSSTYPSQDAELEINKAIAHNIGKRTYTSNYFDGYLAEVNFIDGSALDHEDFGEFDNNGVWRPIRYTGSYGTNGFYLPWSDATIGTDLTSTATLTAPFGGTAENARATDASYLVSNTSTGSSFTLFQQDFGSVQQLSRYEIYGLYFTGGTSTFQIQYSNNASSWTNGATLSVTATGQNFSGNFNFNARYVRLQATAFGVNGTGNIDALIILQDPLGADASGNDNHWNVNNFSVTAGAGNDVMSDTPTTNWCTWNPLKTGTNLAPEDGNLFARMQSGGSGLNQSTTATIYVSSGKWYWEGTSYNTVSGYGQLFGIASESFTALNSFTGSTDQTYGYEKSAFKYNGGTSSSYGASYTTNDVIGVALDLDAGTLVFYKNGVSQGTAFTGISGTFTPYCGLTYSGGGPGFYTNFGQRAFAYTPPTGFKALNTSNLPAPDIAKGSKYFNTVLYTGTAATQSIPNVGFQPDLIWIKARNGAYSHNLTDAVRGITNGLTSNDTIAEYTIGLTSFDTDGFSMGAGNNQINGSTITYAAWNWKEGATQGFDIVSYTGTGANRTVSHNLGVQPSLIIVKNRDRNAAWAIYHSSLGATKVLQFDANGAFTDSTSWNNTSPTSSVFTVGTANSVNALNEDLIAYCFAEVEGYSKFGSYTGSTALPFVWCGFRPKWVLIKNSNSATDWHLFDTARDPSNEVTQALYPDTAGSEDTLTNNEIDILSNGFKLRSTGGSTNGSGNTLIFAAFAEHPTGGSGVSPATAR